MPNPENIRNHKFPKGKSGNPKGRPKKLPELDELLNDILGSEDESKSEAALIIHALVKRAKKGDVRAAEVLLERAYGKVKQPIEHKVEALKGFQIIAASDKRNSGK